MERGATAVARSAIPRWVDRQLRPIPAYSRRSAANRRFAAAGGRTLYRTGGVHPASHTRSGGPRPSKVHVGRRRTGCSAARTGYLGRDRCRRHPMNHRDTDTEMKPRYVVLTRSPVADHDLTWRRRAEFVVLRRLRAEEVADEVIPAAADHVGFVAEAEAAIGE